MNQQVADHSHQLMDWLTLLAIILGPIIGIWVTRIIDKANDLKKQRLDILNTFLTGRGLELSERYIAAINLVPFYFQKNQKVMSSWEAFIDHVNNENWSSPEQSVLDKLNFKLASLRDDLIAEIARAVGRELPSKSEHKRGYAPVGWANTEQEQANIRTALLRVLNAQAPLITVTHLHTEAAGSNTDGSIPSPPKA